jgi:hypothetical protein
MSHNAEVDAHNAKWIRKCFVDLGDTNIASARV